MHSFVWQEEKEELMTKVEDAESCLSDEEDKTKAEKAKLQILQEKQERFSKLNAWKVSNACHPSNQIYAHVFMSYQE